MSDFLAKRHTHCKAYAHSHPQHLPRDAQRKDSKGICVNMTTELPLAFVYKRSFICDPLN